MAPEENPNFSTTNWSVVLAAARSNPEAAGLALERLCRRNWFPVYAFIRQRGHGPHDAEDLAQGFFQFVIERHALQRLDRSKGRFRSFLLAALTNFLHNERDKNLAQKRGGGQSIVSLDDESGETAYALEAGAVGAPEILFERRWAMMLVRRVLEELRGEYEARGQGTTLAGLQPLLTGEATGADYARLGQQLGQEPDTVKVALHRARRRFGELLRREVAHTVETPEEVEAEIRHLMAALAQ